MGSRKQRPRGIFGKISPGYTPVTVWPICLTSFWLRALDTCFHSGLIAGLSDPYNWQRTIIAGSCGQSCGKTQPTGIVPDDHHQIAVQLKLWNYGQFSMSITRYWVNPVIWACSVCRSSHLWSCLFFAFFQIRMGITMLSHFSIILCWNPQFDYFSSNSSSFKCNRTPKMILIRC